MALELDLLLREYRALPVPVVFKRDVVDDENAVQPHGHALAHHLHVEAIPVAHLPVGYRKRLRDVLLVVVEAARADVPLVVRVPYLHLRSTAEVEPRVARHRHDPPVGPKLEVLEVLRRRERIAALEAIEEEVPVPDVPVLAHALVGDLLHLGALLRRRRVANFGVVELALGRHALPVGEVGLAAGEKRLEPFRAFLGLLGADVPHLRVCGKLLYADVAPLDVVAVAEPADGAGEVADAGMGPFVGRVAIAPVARDVPLRDEVPVEIDLDFAAYDLDFREVPHAGPAHVAAAGGEVLLLAAHLLAGIVAERGEYAVHRTGIVVRLELVLLRLSVVVFGAAVVEKLHFAHAVVGGVLAGNEADAEAAVAVRRHAELEPEDEIGVGAGSVEVAALALLEGIAALGEALEDARLLFAHPVERDRTAPAIEVFAVENGGKALVDRFRVLACRCRGGAASERECRKSRRENNSPM